MRIETQPKDTCCDALALPIEECHRSDVAQYHIDHEKMNLWCCACGRFWIGSEIEVQRAQKRLEEEQ